MISYLAVGCKFKSVSEVRESSCLAGTPHAFTFDLRNEDQKDRRQGCKWRDWGFGFTAQNQNQRRGLGTHPVCQRLHWDIAVADSQSKIRAIKRC